MTGTATDKNEHVAAESSDLLSKNPWLASYKGDAARGARVREIRSATRSSGPSARKLGLWVGAAGAVLLMLGISAIASPDHYPLDQSGGIAVLVQRSPVEPLR